MPGSSTGKILIQTYPNLNAYEWSFHSWMLFISSKILARKEKGK